MILKICRIVILLLIAVYLISPLSHAEDPDPWQLSEYYEICPKCKECSNLCEPWQLELDSCIKKFASCKDCVCCTCHNFADFCEQSKLYHTDENKNCMEPTTDNPPNRPVDSLVAYYCERDIKDTEGTIARVCFKAGTTGLGLFNPADLAASLITNQPSQAELIVSGCLRKVNHMPVHAHGFLEGTWKLKGGKSVTKIWGYPDSPKDVRMYTEGKTFTCPNKIIVPNNKIKEVSETLAELTRIINKLKYSFCSVCSSTGYNCQDRAKLYYETIYAIATDGKKPEWPKPPQEEEEICSDESGQPEEPPTFKGGVYVASGDINYWDGYDDVVTGAGEGGNAEVKVFKSKDASVPREFKAFNFSGEVRVATGDVDGNGTPDIITASGPGGGPHVRVYSGNSTTNALVSGPIGSFFAYDSAKFTTGVYVASGDINKDGYDDVITGAGEGIYNSAVVKVFSGKDGSVLKTLSSERFNVGSRVATGDVNRDGTLDIITATDPMPGQVTTVRVYDGTGNTADERVLGPIGTFYPFGRESEEGAYVASGDINNDGYDDVIVGGKNSLVRVFSGKPNEDEKALTPTILWEFTAFDFSSSEVRVATGDVDGDGTPDIITANGPGGKPLVRVHSGTTYLSLPDPIGNFSAY